MGETYKEHCYPRKRAGADLLRDGTGQLSGTEVLADFQAKWGRYNRVTRQENRALVSHQRAGLSMEECYAAAEVVLVDAPDKWVKRTRRKR